MFEQITHAFLAARLWLESVGGAGTAFGALWASVFLLVYLLRKIPWTAKLWERVASVVPALNFDMTPGKVILSKVWQGLFPTLIAAVVGALGSGGSLKVAILGALVGPVTVVSHEFAKWLPFLPYRGAVSAKAALPSKAKWPDDDDSHGGGGGDDELTPPTPRRPVVPTSFGAFALVALLSVMGCALAEAAWPKVAHCLPSSTDLVNEVRTILLNSKSYESDFESLGVRVGRSALACAIQTATDSLLASSGKIGASPADAPAAARGQAFLAKVGTKVEGAR